MSDRYYNTQEYEQVLAGSAPNPFADWSRMELKIEAHAIRGGMAVQAKRLEVIEKTLADIAARVLPST